MSGRRTGRISDAILHRVQRPRRVTDAEVLDVARRVECMIRSHLVGDPREVETWTAVAKSLGACVKAYRCEVREAAPQGFYQGGARIPTIFYDLDATDEQRIRTIVHELGHHVLATWPDSAFPRGTEHYDDDKNTTQHRISRKVEELMIVLIEGGQEPK